MGGAQAGRCAGDSNCGWCEVRRLPTPTRNHFRRNPDNQDNVSDRSRVRGRLQVKGCLAATDANALSCESLRRTEHGTAVLWNVRSRSNPAGLRSFLELNGSGGGNRLGARTRRGATAARAAASASRSRAAAGATPPRAASQAPRHSAPSTWAPCRRSAARTQPAPTRRCDAPSRGPAAQTTLTRWLYVPGPELQRV